ncbi:MAG: ATP-binding protein [Candidatus Gastranaerophilales bacterium]|nr:ATP-binding protein [Candidatus Gastranaerophilales bacterium]
MAKILLITDNNKKINKASELFYKHGHELISFNSDEEIFETVKANDVDVILIDLATKKYDINNVCRKIKIQTQTKNIQTILIFNEGKLENEILKYANAYIQEPFEDSLLLATINASLQHKESLEGLSANNKDLAKSLYQLNVLYNTSTQLAGSLDKTKLIDIMMDGLEKSLSFSLCYSLVFNDPTDITLLINSLYPISKRLEDAIKLRAILSYKTLFSINPAVADIKVIKNIKHQFEEYDLNVFNFDNLFAPINIKDKFFGIIEVFRENDFGQEDTTCFQTLVKQASLPLESAILYEEIKDTNIKLEKLERLKSEFISIVSHELRTPLTAIKNSLDIVLSGKSGEITKNMDKFLNMAKRNVTRLSAIINDLLDLSKIEAGKMDFRFEKANVNSPIEFVKNTFENLAKDKNIELILNLERDIDSVYIDSQRIEQVLTNLVSNAIKFTPENGKITISTSKIKREDILKVPFFAELPKNLFREYVKVEVADTGIGIAHEDLNKVFDKFEQIENSLSRKIGGTGLGLPIARQLMETHKGLIWLESEVNVGSKFSLAIPIMNEEETFIMQMGQDISRAKQNHTSLGLIALKEKIIASASFLDKVVAEKLIKKTTNSRDFIYIDGDFRYYFYYSIEMDSFALDFNKKKLEGYIKLCGKEFEECAILYSTALYPNDALSADELIKKAKLSFKEVEYEKSINS